MGPSRRRGVSELYASLLMVGVTLSLGGAVVVAASSQFGLAANSASLGASLQQSSAGVQVSLVYAAVFPSGSCPTYQGVKEGTSLTVALYNYGAADFAPAELVVNSTAYQGGYGTLALGSLGAYTITLGACAHSSGQTVLAVDSLGDEVQFGT
jgi:flagellin-like protein